MTPYKPEEATSDGKKVRAIARNDSIEVEYSEKPSENMEKAKKSALSQTDGKISSSMKRGFKDSFEYVAAIKNQFKEEPHVYKEFLSIMRSFHTTEYDVETTVDLVSKLFSGHNDMILGFNNFLPEENKIKVEESDDDIPNEIITNSVQLESTTIAEPSSTPTEPNEAVIWKVDEELLEKARKAIPADIRMYSGCRDEQTSAVSVCLCNGFFLCFRISKSLSHCLALLVSHH